MLAQPLRMPDQAGLLQGRDWVFERKLDGLRCIAVRDGASVDLWSRNRLSFSARFPEIVRALAALPVDRFVLDGEVVVFDDRGRTSFSLLQAPQPGRRPVFCVFDVLHLLGSDTTGLPLTERQPLLDRIVGSAGPLITSPERVTGDPVELLSRACGQGWEGLVAKRRSSPYRTGRSPDWRKLKCTLRQEFVVGGWTEPSGSRSGFGALLLGYHLADGTLRFAGKVGTGFDEKTLRNLKAQLDDLAAAQSPFDQRLKERGLHWVRPDLVAEVAFSEWTHDHHIRHPAFLGLRPDKAAAEVTLET